MHTQSDFETDARVLGGAADDTGTVSATRAGLKGDTLQAVGVFELNALNTA
jgi:hypothetical protein